MASTEIEVLILRFGAFELDLRAGELRRGGVLLKLSPQQFRVLRFLAERGGQVCTREEIRREIWGDDVFVDFERGLNVCIAAIRSALNDDSEAPRFIQTVPRQGYRFVAPVEQVTMPAAPCRRARRARGAGASGSRWALSASPWWRPWSACCYRAHKMLLAVLPFENLTQRAEDASLVDGLSDELLTQMGTVDPERLSVIGRTSVRRYRDGKANLAQVRRELGVDYVIEGGGAQRRRCAAHHGPAGEGGRRVAGVERDLSGRGRRPPGAAGNGRGQSSERGDRATLPEQRAVCLCARTLRSRRRARRGGTGAICWPRTGARAIAWFQQAAELDAGWAEPRAALAEAYLGQAMSGGAAAELFPKARSAAQAALQLDERNAEAHDALAQVALLVRLGLGRTRAAIISARWPSTPAWRARITITDSSRW